MDLEQLQNHWRKDNKDPKTTTYIFNTMKRLKKNSFIVEHEGRTDIESMLILSSQHQPMLTMNRGQSLESARHSQHVIT